MPCVNVDDDDYVMMALPNADVANVTRNPRQICDAQLVSIWRLSVCQARSLTFSSDCCTKLLKYFKNAISDQFETLKKPTPLPAWSLADSLHWQCIIFFRKLINYQRSCVGKIKTKSLGLFSHWMKLSCNFWTHCRAQWGQHRVILIHRSFARH